MKKFIFISPEGSTEAPNSSYEVNNMQVIGIVEDLNFNSDEFEMDLNNPTGAIGEIPLALKVTMSIAIIHEEEASSESYKFYHRHDEDDISEQVRKMLGLPL